MKKKFLSHIIISTFLLVIMVAAGGCDYIFFSEFTIGGEVYREWEEVNENNEMRTKTEPLEGVEIDVNGEIVETDSEGEWEKEGVEGSVDVRVDSDNGFSPPYYHNINTSRRDLDFVYKVEYYQVEGTIIDSEGEPLTGVEIKNAEGDVLYTTGGEGEFIITGLEAGQEYTLSPHLEGYEFQPAEITVDSARESVDFVGSEYIVEGVVIDTGGNNLVGAVVIVEDEDENEIKKVTTNTEGEYKVTGLEVGKKYILRAEKDNYSFQPEEIEIDSSREDADFEAYEFVVEGKVVDIEGEGIFGVGISVKNDDGNIITTAYTDEEGNYKVNELEVGEKYILETVEDNFQPDEITVEGPRDDANFKEKQ